MAVTKSGQASGPETQHPPPIHAETAAAVLRALASEHRIRLVRRLVKQELSCEDPSNCSESERCCDVAELAHAVECSLPTVSYHLKELKQAGIVVAKRRGRHMFYSVNRELIGQAANYILEVAQ